MPQAVRKMVAAEQLQWVRRKLDALHQEAARRGVRGWVIVAAVIGWLGDWEHELSK